MKLSRIQLSCHPFQIDTSCAIHSSYSFVTPESRFCVLEWDGGGKFYLSDGAQRHILIWLNRTLRLNALVESEVEGQAENDPLVQFFEGHAIGRCLRSEMHTPRILFFPRVELATWSQFIQETRDQDDQQVLSWLLQRTLMKDPKYGLSLFREAPFVPEALPGFEVKMPTPKARELLHTLDMSKMSPQEMIWLAEQLDIEDRLEKVEPRVSKCDQCMKTTWDVMGAFLGSIVSIFGDIKNTVDYWLSTDPPKKPSNRPNRSKFYIAPYEASLRSRQAY